MKQQADACNMANAYVDYYDAPADSMHPYSNKGAPELK